MYKRILTVAAMATMLAAWSSCKNNTAFQKTKDGVEYKIVTDEKGEAAKVGDFIKYNMIVKIGDSLMYNSAQMTGGAPVEMELQDPPPQTNKAMDPTEVIKMMSAGDSAVIRIELDSMARQMYKFAKPTDKLEFQFKMIEVQSKDKHAEDVKKQAEAQKAIDEKLISDYLAANNLTAQKTASGLYYVITKPGTGANAASGQTVKVNYTGQLLNGTKFDSNTDPQFQHVEPLEFAIGQGQVIPGWDEGLALLNKNAKATLIIPSYLAYGSQSPNAIIPQNSVLVFDVELLDVK